METRETCILSFTTSLGKNMAVRIRDPRPALNASVAETAAGMLKSVDVFDETVGSLADYIGAEVISVTTNPII